MSHSNLSACRVHIMPNMSEMPKVQGYLLSLLIFVLSLLSYSSPLPGAPRLLLPLDVPKRHSSVLMPAEHTLYDVAIRSRAAIKDRSC